MMEGNEAKNSMLVSLKIEVGKTSKAVFRVLYEKVSLIVIILTI